MIATTVGHLTKVCCNKKATELNTLIAVDHEIMEDIEDTEETYMYTLFHLPGARESPFMVTMQLIRVTLHMEVDTGTSAYIISNQTYKTFSPNAEHPLSISLTCNLHTYVH